MSRTVFIGTSGWHYKHWLGSFYPEKLPAAQMLPFYARYFDTVEINNSFYRLPSVETLEKWRDISPEGFCFAAKASRFITHMKKLKEPENALDKFLPAILALGHKLGPILFQLPPNWGRNAERLDALLGLLPKELRYGFELRDASWHSPEIYEVLRRHNAAFCIYEIAGYQSPIEVTSSFTYVRLHGPKKEAYQGSYDHASLSMWADRVEGWSRELDAVYIYFDNDQAGYAAQNALDLKDLLSRRGVI